MKARVVSLHLYPVKGCRGVDLTQAEVEAAGLAREGIGDREWVVVDDEGEFLSQREHPKMALIEPKFGFAELRIRAPGMLELLVPFASEGDVVQARVWDDRVSAVTQGEVADAWFSAYLGRPARLLRFDPEHTRLANHRYTGRHDAPYRFADAFPFLVTNRASLDDLNARLAQRGHAPVTMARFRPNLVIEGLPAYEEDYVKALRLGELELRPVKRCARCSVPGVDPASGEADQVVPDLLATYRATDDGVLFGVNAIVAAGAGHVVRVGDAFDVELSL